MKKTNVINEVFKLAEPIAKELNLDIWDINFVKEGQNRFLRIFIDKAGGVNIEDCERFSRAIDEPLDLLDSIKESYCLEVSSPGIERKLTKDEHFKRFIGSPIMVKLIRPNENKKREFCGILKDFKDDSSFSVLDDEGNILHFDKKDISYVKLDDFRRDL